jgi:hypothetical protein
VIGKLIAGVMAVVGAAAVTLAVMIGLVKATTIAVSFDHVGLRFLAVTADVLSGTLLLLGCIYLTTRLAVLILGVGQAEFPPPPDQTPQDDPPKN